MGNGHCYLCIWPSKKWKQLHLEWLPIERHRRAANKLKIGPFLSRDLFKHFDLQTKDMKCLICWNATAVGWLFSLHSKYDYYFLVCTTRAAQHFLNNCSIVDGVGGYLFDLVGSCADWISDYDQSMQKKELAWSEIFPQVWWICKIILMVSKFVWHEGFLKTCNIK